MLPTGVKAPPWPGAWLDAGEARLKPPVLPPKPGVLPKAKVLLEAGVAPKGWLVVAPKLGSPKPVPGHLVRLAELLARPGRDGLLWCRGCTWHPEVVVSAWCGVGGCGKCRVYGPGCHARVGV